MTKIWNKESIVSLLMQKDDAVVRAIQTLYARQTADERASSATKHSNGIGFTGTDARFLSSVAQALPQYNNKMTAKQLEVARRMLPKYWRQLLEAAAEKGAQVDMKVKRPKNVPEIVKESMIDEDIEASNAFAAYEAEQEAKAHMAKAESWGRF
jgi:transposase-like protein